jgi:hypothetical protein
MIHWIPIIGKRIAWNNALNEMPEVAKKLGLKFSISGNKYKIGKISGSYKGHKIAIDIDEQKIYIYLSKSADNSLNNFVLSTNKDNSRTETEDFMSGYRWFDRLFKTKKIPKELYEKFKSHTVFYKSMHQIKKKYGSYIGFMSLENSYLSLGFKNKGFTDKRFDGYYIDHSTERVYYYIPSSFILNFIPDIVDCLAGLEKINE